MRSTIRTDPTRGQGNAYRVPPCTCAGCEVTPTGVPLGIGHCVVVSGTEVLNTAAPRRALTTSFLNIEVEVPELELGLARRADSREYDMATTW